MVVTSLVKSAVKNLVRALLRSEGHYSSWISNLEYKLLIGRGVKLAFQFMILRIQSLINDLVNYSCHKRTSQISSFRVVLDSVFR